MIDLWTPAVGLPGTFCSSSGLEQEIATRSHERAGCRTPDIYGYESKSWVLCQGVPVDSATPAFRQWDARLRQTTKGEVVHNTWQIAIYE